MRRAAAVLLVLGALAPVASAQKIIPTYRLDPATDGRGPLDIVRVAMANGTNDKLRGEVTMEHAWTTDDLRGSGGDGSICLTLFARREPGADPPDWLVCVTPPKVGEALRGRVLRDRANGPPRPVASVTVTRPTARTVYLRFAKSAIHRPPSVRFAAESVTRGRGCPRPLGCRDTAPDAPTTGNLTLHSTAPSG